MLLNGMKHCIAAIIVAAAMVARSGTVVFKFDPEAHSVGTSLSGIETPLGTWLSVPYGFRVVACPADIGAGKAVSSNWKGHGSKYLLTKPLWDNFTLTFRFNRTKDRDDGEVFVGVGSGGSATQAGVSINAGGSIAYLDGASRDKYRRTKVPLDVFTASVGTWHTATLVVRPDTSAGGSYDILVDGESIVQGISFPWGRKAMIQSVILRASTAPDPGGRSILLDDFNIVKGEGGGDKLPRFKVTVTPVPDLLGSCFVHGKAIRFDLEVDGYFPDERIEAKCSASPYYRPERPVLADVRLELDAHGRASIGLSTLPKGGYWLKIEVSYGGKRVTMHEHSFAVLSSAPPPPKNMDREWLGLCTHLEYNAPGSAQFETDVRLIKLMGIRWIRMNNSWDWYHRSPDEPPDVSLRGKIADRLVLEGINWVEAIQATPAWASSAPRDGYARYRHPPRDWNVWRTYVKALAERLKNTPARYMIWCEPCSFMSVDRVTDRWPGGLPAAVAQFGRIAEKTIHGVSPDAVVMGPSSSGGAPRWTRTLLENYGTFYDQITFHYPRWPNTPRSVNQRILRDITRHADHPLPMISGEARSLAGTRPGTEEDLARNLKEYMRQWAEGITRRFYSFLLRHPHTSDAPGGCYLTADFQPRPGMVVLQTLVARTRNANFVAELDLGENVEGYLLGRGDSRCIVMWTTSAEAKPLPKGLDTPAIKAFDMYGNEHPAAGLQIGTKPVYLENVNPSAPCIGATSIQMRPYCFRLDDDLVLPVTLTLANHTGTARRIALHFGDPTVIVVPATVSRKLAPWQITSVPVKVRARPGHRVVFKTTSLTAKIDGKTRIMARVYHFDDRRTRTIDVACFAPENPLWTKTSAFKHSATDGDVDGDSRVFHCEPKPLETGGYTGVFHVEFAPRKTSSWLGAHFSRGTPLKLPDIPFRVRFKVRATARMLPSPVALLCRFIDAKGKHVQFHGLAPWIYPSPGPETRTYECTIDSPISSQMIHSQWGGEKDAMYYPLAFEGFSINPTPDRPPGRWTGDIEIEAIEMDTYTPPKRVEKLVHRRSDNILAIAH